MIISASRKTDIPAFFSEWFINRIREGYVYSRNPMNSYQISKIPLTPDVVDCIVFWTKNPIPMIQRLVELKDYTYYFQFTLTGYGKDMELNLPDKKRKLIPAFKQLSEKIGSERIIWRYDPIAFNEKYTPEYHIKAYSHIAGELKGYTKKSVISFVDIYHKIQKNMQEMNITETSDETMYSFAQKLYDIAGKNEMVLATCAEKIDLASIGIEHNACIDGKMIERLCRGNIKAKKDLSQRAECQCVESRDVGSYNTCSHGCKYCYANYSGKVLKKNLAKYDSKSPILCDFVDEADGDIITEVKAKALIDRQVSLF
ncbi:MAG: DUF1848 domain-containing protein [Acidaminococcaceae bacterium]|nr:DUF1848 domain-containing protein [Acidaminococcaceae bacterium]